MEIFFQSLGSVIFVVIGQDCHARKLVIYLNLQL